MYGVSAYHRRRARATMNATATLRRPGMVKGPFDPATLTYPMTPHPPYATTPCRAQPAATSPRFADVAGDQLTTLRYIVSVPANTAVQAGDVARIDDADDELLNGRDLTVDDLLLESDHVERSLLCSLAT